MKEALWILGGILAADMAVVAYLIARATDYDDSVGALAFGLLVGLPVLGALCAVLVICVRNRRLNMSTLIPALGRSYPLLVHCLEANLRQTNEE